MGSTSFKSRIVVKLHVVIKSKRVLDFQNISLSRTSHFPGHYMLVYKSAIYKYVSLAHWLHPGYGHWQRAWWGVDKAARCPEASSGGASGLK